MACASIIEHAARRALLRTIGAYSGAAVGAEKWQANNIAAMKNINVAGRKEVNKRQMRDASGRIHCQQRRRGVSS